MTPLPVGLSCPPLDGHPQVQVEIGAAGSVATDWARVVDDGTQGPVDLPFLVGIVRHPQATVAVDSGLGQTTRDGHYPPRWSSHVFPVSLPPGQALVEQLDGPPDLVLLTHTHYDHVGGLFDLPGTAVWMTVADWGAIDQGTWQFPRELARTLDVHPVPLRAGKASQVLGRPAVDVLGDGSLWYLSLPGHTPGAAAVLARAADGPWLFIGDTAWVDAHLGTARRPLLTALLIDADIGEVGESLDWARWLNASCPDLQVVAGHEPRWVAPDPSPAEP